MGGIERRMLIKGAAAGGLALVGGGTERLARLVRDDAAKYARLVRELNIKTS